MKAFFGRKVSNLKELKGLTETILSKERGKGSSYIVTKEVALGNEEFQMFSNDFFLERDWLTKGDGGIGKDRKIRCIRVINAETGEAILVNNEGYNYARYTAIEM